MSTTDEAARLLAEIHAARGLMRGSDEAEALGPARPSAGEL